jgi:phosphoribosylaminoimidazolecarboxamide formyltransferase/IMP cyclohydrolase
MVTHTIRRALISVSDKSRLVPFARGLSRFGVEIVSTGGTARELETAGIPVTPIEAVTGIREMMAGRVKTLHPAVHGAILADRAQPEQMRDLEELRASPIDLVVVNLYPFEATIARPGATFEDAIENIDIGGPAMLRSAAKNHASVTVLVSPEDYDTVLEEMAADNGAVSAATRHRLAQKAFAHTAAYDTAISRFFAFQLPLSQNWERGPGGEGRSPNGPRAESPFPDRLTFTALKRHDLRYGENPHQAGAFYVVEGATEPGIATARQLHGMELSYINLLDLDAAWQLVQEFDEPAAAIIKHTNPCGCGIGATLADAYRKARDGELPPFNPPGSRFGGIIAFNRIVDRATAEEVIAPKSFYHAIIAPEYEPEARALLEGRQGWGPNLRLLAVEGSNAVSQIDEGGNVTTGSTAVASNVAGSASQETAWQLRSIGSGLLVQEPDRRPLGPEDVKIVTQRKPTETEMSDMLFAWKVVKHVKSNAIVLARDGQVIGVGAGQMNRALPVDLAVAMAGDRVKGAALASDAFFPHPDGPEHAARAGVTAIIQPGGSNRDADAITVADRHGLAMVFTGVRHFRH